MKITLPLTLGFTALVSLAHADEELAPPDVDFYAEAQMMRADMDPYGFDTADGLNIKIGMWLNSVKLGKTAASGWKAVLSAKAKSPMTASSPARPVFPNKTPEQAPSWCRKKILWI